MRDVKKILPLLPVVLILSQVTTLATSQTFVERDFSSPEIYLQGAEVIDGKVRLGIRPEQISDKLSLRLEKIGGDNWVPLENIDSWADYDGKAMVGVKDEYGRSYIYVLWRAGSYSDEFRRYEISTNRWEVLSSPTDSGLGVVKNGVCMAWDGRYYIYVMRGGVYSDFYRDFWRYNIKTNSWEVLENTPWYQGAGNTMAWVQLGGKEYIYAIIGTTSSSAVAGRRGMVFARFNIVAWEMDPDNEPSKWEVIQWVSGYTRYGVSGSIPYGCDDGSSMVWTGDNYLYYLVGAYNETMSGPDESHFLRYHLIENRWEELAPIPYNGRPEDRSGVDDGGSIVWAGGYIYAVKGGDGAGHDYSDNFYRYCIGTNTWERAASLPEGVGRRNGNRLATVDGVVYFLRGHGSTGFWRYSPPLFSTTRTFSSRVIDAGAETDWGKIFWSYSEPEGVIESVFQASDEPSTLPDGSNRLGQLRMWYPANYPVISEFATRGPDNAYQEFIEIYNPAASETDLTGWKIQYRSATGTAWYDRVVFPSGAKIPAHGFYLAVNENGYPGRVIDGVQADVSIISSIADSGHLRLVDSSGKVVDAVSYGSGHNYTEEGPPAPNHGTTSNNRSVERRATPFSTVADMSTGGMHENIGNACDTNNNAFDFVVRAVRNPQSSSSPPEIPPSPMPLSSYLQTIALDGFSENIVEVSIGQQSQVYLENQQITAVLVGDNLNSPDLMNDDDGTYFEVIPEIFDIFEENWQPLAPWPGRISVNAAACYAENILSGKKYVYAHDTVILYRYDIAGNSWENLGPLPATGAAGSGMVWTGGDFIYMTRGGSVTTFWRYKISDNTWVTLASTPSTQLSGSSLAWAGGDNIYAVLRGTDNGLYVYSISANTWTKLFDMKYGSVPAGAASGSSLAALGGYLYYGVGGTRDYWRYRIADNVWENLASPPASWGAGGAQEVVSENYIYAVRGGTTTSFYRFVVKENRWETLTSLPATVSWANDRLVFDGTFLYMIRSNEDNQFWRYPKMTSRYDISIECSLQISLPSGYFAENVGVLLNLASENEATYYLGIYNWSTGTYNENSLRHSGDSSIENVVIVRVVGREHISDDNRIKVRIRSSEQSAYKLLVDRLLIEIQAIRYQYGLKWCHVLSGLDSSYENAEIVILGFSEGDEKVGISVWKNSISNWVTLGVLPTSPYPMSFSLSALSDYLVGGENLIIKLEDLDKTDWTQTTIYIDYLATRAVKSYGTSISVEVRFGSDNDPTDEPSPPENWTDWIAFNVGDNLASRFRYLQYRVRLSSTDFRFSPLVEVLEIEHFPLIPREGVFVSQPLLLGYVDSWGRLKFDADLPADTFIKFFTRSSPDGFVWSEWEPLDSGNIQSPVYNCRYLQVKAILRGFGSSSPVLNEYSIEYAPDKTPPTVIVIEPKDGFVTTQDRIMVRGSVSDRNPIRLEINGASVIFEPGAFEKEIRLSPGQNVIRIVASDVAGNKKEIHIRGTMETSQPTQPTIPSPTYFVAALIVGGVIVGVSLIYIFAPAFVKMTIKKGFLVFPGITLVFSMILSSSSVAALSSWKGSWVSDYNDFKFGEFENVTSFTSGVLALQPEKYWGNDFAASYYYTEWTNLDSPEKKVSIRFVAQNSKTLTGFMIYLYQTGQDLTWRFRLELDDGTGKPSGALAWSNAWQTLKITSSKWWTIDLLSPGALRKGEIYHIVISWENFGIPPSSQDFVNIRSLWPFNRTWINGLTTNDNRGILIFDGSSWKDLGRDPVYILNFSDKTYDGNPYYTLRTDAHEIGVFGDNAKGERFQTESFRRVVGVEVYARRNGSPQDNLYFILQRGASVLANVSIGSSATIENRWGWVGALLNVPLTLPPAQYILGLKSPGSTSGNRYDVCLLGTYSSSPHPDLTFSGTASCFIYSANGGVTWSTKSKMQDDVPFRFIESFKKSGVFTSRIFDAGDIMKWERLDWDGRIPDGTSLIFQTRSSNDNVRWSLWEDVGSDGLIMSPTGRYVQYRALFSTQNEYATPTLNKITIYFSDSSPPKIVSVTPMSGQTVFSTTPRIEIVLEDISGIDQNSIVMKIDGQEVNFSYDSATKTVWFLPEKSLSAGEHEVYISLRDGAGNLLEERWTFLIRTEEGLRTDWVIASLVVAVVVVLVILKLRR